MKTKYCLPSFLQVAFIILLFLVGIQFAMAQKSVSVYVGSNHPMVQFAADELNNVLEKAKYEVKSTGIEQADILLMVSGDLEKSSAAGQSFLNREFQLKPEGFYIRKSNAGKIGVIGADEAGVMYGGLELAEQISLYGMDGIQNTEQNPYMEVRGTKFNIPLDVRTPSYTDPCDVAQFNIPEVWSFDFWQQYIDNLAKNRYNLISLWNLHPFPSLVKVPDYPDVALDDVQRSTVQWDEYYDRNGWGFDAPEILANPEIVKKISMDEKIAFWQKVMKYAKERNIRFYIITWNIFVNGTDGKYGITDKIDNQVTRDYFRKSVRQMFATYPDLAGIGLTTGENMPNRTSEEKEEWAYQTFGLGVMDAAKEEPDRKFTLVHRQHQSGAQAIARRFAPLIENKNIDFLFSFKYAQAHVMSSTRQTMHQKYVEDIKGMKTLWTLRNDDNYYFRWGAPDFIREFIRNIPMDVTKGFYYGSDQYVWGRDFLAAEPEVPRRLEVEKHWYHWMIWGRLGYNPDLGNDRFVKLIENRFPDVQAKTLFDAWQEASMIYPKTTGFHWGALDFQWYIEACKSAPVYSDTESGFHDVNRFISLPPHPGTGYQSIPEYVKLVVAKGKSERVTPLEVSRQIHEHSDKAIQFVSQLTAGNNKELSNTLEDIRSMALLGKYYAHKIHGATALALFRATGDKNHQDEAVGQLTQALDYWVMYYKNAMKQYKNPLWTNRVGHVDWVKLTDEVKKDIAIARLDCTASLENGVLKLANSKIVRTYDWNGGHIITRSVTDKSSGKVWMTHNKKPDLSLPGEAEKAENGSFSAKMVEESAIAPAHLEAEIICSLGKLSIRRVFRIYPDCPAIACDLYFRGESANIWIQPGTNLADMSNIEKLTAANSASKTPVMENLELPGRHWQLQAVEFFDITDRFNTLVREVGALSYRPNLYRGNLLFAHDNVEDNGIFILKEAPVSSVQLAYPGGDFIAEYGHLKAVGIGVNPADLDKDEWVRGYGFVTGVYSGGENNALTALRSYQKMIRSLQPGRDEMILMNTWGDRGQDTRVRESFAFTELEAGAKLGITHFQLDDGWQTGRSSNSAFQGGSLVSIWNNPKYWEPHPEKFPNGLAPVVKKGKELGIEVCLWFNPSKDNSNENWEKDADVLIGLYRKYGIRTFKIDGVNLPDKKAEINFRKFLDKVNRETDRQVVFNLDVTAGRRGGYHYFNEYGNLFLENRYTDWTNYYPYTTLRNLWMLSKYVPAEKLQIEFLNKWRNADKYGNDPFAPGNYSFDYLFAITMVAQPLAWFEGSGLPAEAVAISAPLIEKYRKIQHDLHQGTILPIGEEPSGRSWTGFQSLKEGKGYFIVFREGNDKPVYAMKTWLEPGARFRCTLLAGSGQSFGATADANGTVTFRLEQKNSFALYQYELE